MAWNIDTVERFTRITGADIKSLLQDFTIFNNTLKQKIYDYYKGKDKRANGKAFEMLEELSESYQEAIQLLRINRESFTLYEDLELFLEIEEIDSKLSAIGQSSKFLRSSIINNNFNQSPSLDFTLSKNQTLENLSRKLNIENGQDNWVELFLNNKITEESYTTDNGALINASFGGVDGFELQSVIDNLDTVDKLKGIDLDQKIQFDATENDLKVLTYTTTLNQTVNILTRLTKGSVPEFPSQGIDSSLAVGSTIGAIAFPAIFRQLYSNFESDDFFKTISVNNLDFKGDGVEISFELATKSNDFIQSNLTI
jgi:hypothetical protein